ncbi:hypothetical protein C7C46_30275 [Streptomyces tateyamensis]|uniref:Uncharacterized protein n=1 Tax=Streptomyces tateyamensis TaxID=565073 RepID=A0A2V4N843_9ACTN|nr:hypothetical protein C7C46_30275 [Streptomyces tateyamensis]
MTDDVPAADPLPADGALAEQLRGRLAELRRELRLGEEQLAGLARQEAVLRQQLLQVAGAVQVLTELVGEPAPGARVAPQQPGPPPRRVVVG